jgi:dual-specificity kinase
MSSLPTYQQEIAAESVLKGRYVVIERCGEGSFSSVFRCWDVVADRQVAIKVMKAGTKTERKLLCAVQREMRMLQDIASHERSIGIPSGCLQVFDVFKDSGYVCLALESLGTSYVEYLRINGYQSMPLMLVKSVMRQVLHSLAFLHNMGVVHLDIKPHNILAERTLTASESVQCADGVVRTMELPVSSAVRLIDFGGSRYEDDTENGYSYTTEFRSPEVILDLDITTAADMWSFGTVLIQLYTGRLLFPRLTGGKISDLCHFSQMARVLGSPYPRDMAMEALVESDYALNVFAENGRLFRCPEARRAPILTLEQRVKPEDAALLNLLKRCLRYNPAERITASEALNHPFFAAIDGGERPCTQALSLPPLDVGAAAAGLVSLGDPSTIALKPVVPTR